jgi:hypothetical protein
MSIALQYLFGGSASQYRVREEHEGGFKFQIASADVAAEIVLRGKWAVGPIWMAFSLTRKRLAALDVLHARHARVSMASKKGTAVFLTAKSPGQSASTCSDGTQVYRRRDYSHTGGTALPPHGSQRQTPPATCTVNTVLPLTPMWGIQRPLRKFLRLKVFYRTWKTRRLSRQTSDAAPRKTQGHSRGQKLIK